MIIDSSMILWLITGHILVLVNHLSICSLYILKPNITGNTFFMLFANYENHCTNTDQNHTNNLYDAFKYRVPLDGALYMFRLTMYLW